MLKLKNVSKFYYNNGVVASGFSKINLDLKIGEFVVITGESGSGKSTLLNVISGLDSYEEGEMYINGEETSYYNEADFEEYRKKYIANIFQNFNLINSYTVYENLELIYILNNLNDKLMNEKINDLLNQVGLSKFKNTKVSKLSGGQKQRVAIARALAKDTPIIVADEPTGNLDSKSASEIVKLLYEISKNKLVVIVTHNYEQVSEYATRKIKMHDGKIIEDILISKTSEVKYIDKEYGYASFKDKIKLAFKNTFNIIPKFLLLLLVFLILSISVIGEYTSTMKSNYDNSLFGFNSFFSDTSDNRLVVKKKDGSTISDDDFKNISNIDNVDYIVRDDITKDIEINLSDDNNYFYGILNDIEFCDKVDEGRLPTSYDEVVITDISNRYYSQNYDDVLGKELRLYVDSESISYPVKIVGVKHIDESSAFDYKTKIYADKKLIDNASKLMISTRSNVSFSLNNNVFDKYSIYTIYPTDKVSSGSVFIPESMSYYCKLINYNYNCKNNNLDINVENMYYSSSVSLKISNVFNKNNIEKLTGLKDYDYYSYYIFVNDSDYYNLFDKKPYQSSIYVSDVKKIDDVIKTLDNSGYNVLKIKDTIVDLSEDLKVFTNLFKGIGIVIALVALFFISYFVIKIIFKSRNIYYSTVRILGGSLSDVKMLINSELNIVLTISYLFIVILSILVVNNIINIPYIKDLVTYLKVSDYIILYVILFMMSLLISTKYSRSMFKKSAMKSYREV